MIQYGQPEVLDRYVHTSGENAVSIVTQIPTITLQVDRFSQLLQRPSRRRMVRDIEMQQPARAVVDHHEKADQPEARRDRYEEVAGDNCLGVVS